MGGIAVQNVNQKVTVLIGRLFIGLKIFFLRVGNRGNGSEILSFLTI
jgi:hypothetical protein